MANNQNLIPFQKGDPRINRSGRPKKADIMRELAKKVCYEPIDLSTDQAARNHVEAILREWMTSGDFRKQLAVIQYAFGRVPGNEKPKKERNHVIIDWGDDEKMSGPTRNHGLLMKRSKTLRLRSLAEWRRHEATRNGGTTEHSGVVSPQQRSKVDTPK